MAYTPKLPPLSSSIRVTEVSLPREAPVTSVSVVTGGRHRTSGSFEQPGPEALGIDRLLSKWLHTECVASSRCASNTNSLCGEFGRWAGSSVSHITNDDFNGLLRRRGFAFDENGELDGLVLAADFIAALQYERVQKGLPAECGRILVQGATPVTMIITAKQKKFEIPTEGEHLAVLADVVDLGEVETNYGRKDQVQFRWLVEQKGKDGKPLAVRQRPHNKSMHEKASLRHDIKRILGADPGDTFDVDTLLGVNANLTIEHYTRDGNTYANITDIRRPVNGDGLLKIPDDFKRDDGTKDNGFHASRNAHHDREIALEEGYVP